MEVVLSGGDTFGLLTPVPSNAHTFAYIWSPNLSLLVKIPAIISGMADLGSKVDSLQTKAALPTGLSELMGTLA